MLLLNIVHNVLAIWIMKNIRESSRKNRGRIISGRVRISQVQEQAVKIINDLFTF